MSIGAALKKKMDEHPAVAYFSAIVVGLGLATGPLYVIVKDGLDNRVSKLEAELATQQQKSDAEISRLERSLSTLPIQVGSETQVIDIEQMQVAQGDVQAPPGTEYFADGGFYALSSGEGWEATTSTELQLLADVLDQSLSETVRVFASVSGMPESEAENLLTLYPVYLWRSQPVIRLRGTGFKALQPQLLVQTIPLDDPASLFGNLGADEVGSILSSQLNTFALLEGPNAATNISTVDKAEGGLSARFDTIFTDIVVDGVRVDRFFMSTQVVAIATAEDLYLIKATLPSLEPAMDQAFVKKWLASFRIVTT